MQSRALPYRIDRYIIGQLSLALVLVTTGLVALIWLTQSLRFIQIIVDHGLSPFVFVKLTALLVPSFLATILPITCFIVVLFIYARMAGDRELTIMRGIGLSDASLARPAMGVAAAAMLICYILNLGVVPAALGAFRDYQYEIRNQIAAFLLQPGVFFFRLPEHREVGIGVFPEREEILVRRLRLAGGSIHPDARQDRVRLARNQGPRPPIEQAPEL